MVSPIVPRAAASGYLGWVFVRGPGEEVWSSSLSCGRPPVEKHVDYFRLLYEGDGGVQSKKVEDAFQAVLNY